MKNLLFLLLLFTFTSCESTLLLFSSQHPAKISSDGKSLFLEGILGRTAHKRMIRALEKYPDADTLVFIQSDGSMNDEYNIQTAGLIHQRGMITKLLPTTEIASGAVDLFLAGKKCIIPKGAKIGIHSWSDGDKEGKDYPKESEEHELFWKYYEQVNIDTAFYWYTLKVADFENIYWINEEEIERFNLRKN